MEESNSYEKSRAMPFSSVPAGNVLSYEVIKNPLDEVILATENRIKSDWPHFLKEIPGMKALFQLFVAIAGNTFHTIRYFCADNTEELKGKLEYSLSATPLIRTLLDQVFALAFISEDPVSRVALYYNSGWKEMQQTYLRYNNKFGNDPAWRPWLTEKLALLEETRGEWDIPPEIANQLRPGPYWPTPGKMKKRANGETKIYLDHLDEWFYKQYSQSAHLSFPGLALRGGALAMAKGARRQEYLQKSRSDAVLSSISMVLSILSEIESVCKFGNIARLQYLWTVVGEYWPEAKEIYSLRYQRRFFAN